jgi:hypothetical protein
VSIEHDSPFVDDPYGVEPLANYHKSQVTRMKAKPKSWNDLPIVVLLPYSFNHLSILPSNQFSSPSNHTLLQPILPFPSNSLFAFFPYSQPYVAILNIVLSVLTTNENFQKDFMIKTNLLCNPTKIAIRSPLEVKKM